MYISEDKNCFKLDKLIYSMGKDQLTIWDENDMDIFAPKRKTIKELRQEYKEKFNRKLLERDILSEGEKIKYFFPLKKEEFIDFFNNNDWEIGKNYYMNKGVSQMFITSLSFYANKDKSDLLISDVITIYRAMQNAFPGGIGDTECKKFKKANKLPPFGRSQYIFMERYVEEFVKKKY